MFLWSFWSITKSFNLKRESYAFLPDRYEHAVSIGAVLYSYTT